MCNRQNLCKSDNCDICFNLSFASFDKNKVSCWNLIKNNNTTPREVTKRNGKKFWFTCNKCNHDFDSTLANATKPKNPQWCPYCSHQKICLEHNCSSCFNRSFASFDKNKVTCWHPTRNNTTPREVTKRNGKKFWFTCNKCNHDFDSTLANATKPKNPTWCPYCSHQKICLEHNCSSCFNRSFASFDKVTCWHPTRNNNVTPREVAKYSNKKYWFKCNTCNHDFDSTLANISDIKNPTWCPKCAKAQYSQACIKWLMTLQNYSNILHAENGGEHKLFKTDKNRYAKADGYDPTTNTIYEFHGCYWHGCITCYPNDRDFKLFTKKTRDQAFKNTIIREQKIKDIGYNLVVIWEHDFNSTINL